MADFVIRGICQFLDFPFCHQGAMRTWCLCVFTDKSLERMPGIYQVCVLLEEISDCCSRLALEHAGIAPGEEGGLGSCSPPSNRELGRAGSSLHGGKAGAMPTQT